MIILFKMNLVHVHNYFHSALFRIDHGIFIKHEITYQKETLSTRDSIICQMKSVFKTFLPVE